MTPMGLGDGFREKLFVGGGFFYPDGYGVCYCPLKKLTFFQITCSKSDKSRATKEFSIAITQAINDLIELLK